MHLFLPFYVSLAMWTIGTATADLNAYANYTSPFVGDKARRGAYFRDDQYLVNLNDGNRRLRRIQLWCGPAVWQMIPWYERHDGSDSQHWQYGSNDRQGTYKEMVLGKNEWITQVRVDKCPLGNKDWRICYIEILKNRQGSQISSQSDWLSCGQIQYGRRLRTLG